MEELARTNIEPQAWSDGRFKILARLLGLPKAKYAVIECAEIWAWQTAHFTREAPTYVVSRDLVIAILDHDQAVEFLVRARLAEETPEGVRMKGGVDRIEWLCELKEKGLKASAAAAAKREASRESTRKEQASQIDNRSDTHNRVPAGIPTGSARLTPLRSSDPQISDPGSQPPARTPPVEREQAHRARAIVPPHAGTAPRAQQALSLFPAGWVPEVTPQAEQLGNEARGRGVDVDHELVKFTLHVVAESWARADWQAAWLKWLVDARPTDERIREARTKQHAAAHRALEREEQRRANARELTPEDRAELLRLNETLKRFDTLPVPITDAQGKRTA